jgi:nitrate reductase assembly molybdenum cofactor insertion protein NarJ
MNSAEELLREAAEWRMISLLFDCPRGDWFKQVDELADQVTDIKLKQAAIAVRHEASEGLFHSIFGPGGPAPGREVSYRSWVEPGQLLSELAAFYSAFCYTPATGEVTDHISVETGFVAYLRLKELYARESGDDESAEITADAANRFMSDHISKYAQKVNKLFSASGIEYLRLASEALFERVGPDKDKELKTFLPVLEEEDEAFFDCGAAAV